MNERKARIIRGCGLGLMMFVVALAHPAFNKSSEIFSFNQIIFFVILPLLIIIPLISERLIESTMMKWKSLGDNNPQLEILIASSMGIWMSYVFAYSAFDYLGDMRAILLSAVLYAYVFIWIGASVVAFFVGHD